EIGDEQLAGFGLQLRIGDDDVAMAELAARLAEDCEEGQIVLKKRMVRTRSIEAGDIHPSCPAISVTASTNGRRILAGEPSTVAPRGTSLTTTAPAPISASSPTWTPATMFAPEPIITRSPKVTGCGIG